MGVYRGIAEDGVVINSGVATLQTLTLTDGLDLPSGTVAAAGTTQGTAAAALRGFNVVTGATGTNGVVLPAAVPGRVVIIKNTAAAAALLVYPPVGGQINALAANAAFSMGNLTAVTLVASSATQWFSVPLVAS